MNEKILAAIEETLPQMQVDAIRKALTELDGLRDAVKQQKDALSEYGDRDRDQRKRIQELEQRGLELTELLSAMTQEREKYKESSDKAALYRVEGMLEATKSTMEKFLKNTIYRESLQHQIADEYTGVSMQWVNGQQQVVPTPGKTFRQVEDTKWCIR